MSAPELVNPKHPFKWRHFLPEIILLNVRWYSRYALSYRNLEEMMCERGVEVDHTTIHRWVQAYAPELDKRIRANLKPTNDSWRIDETYIPVKGEWKYLYRAVDSQGNTLDFLLTAKRNAKAYPKAMDALKADETLPEETELRQNKYLNKRIEQDHRFIKRLVNPGMGFGSFNTARRTLRGYEAMNMIRKGQVQGVERGDIYAQVEYARSNFRSCRITRSD